MWLAFHAFVLTYEEPVLAQSFGTNFSPTKRQQAIRELARAMFDRRGNLPAPPGIDPDMSAPIVCNQPGGRELMTARR